MDRRTLQILRSIPRHTGLQTWFPGNLEILFIYCIDDTFCAMSPIIQTAVGGSCSLPMFPAQI